MSIVSMALPVGALGYIVSSGLEAVQRWLDRMDAGTYGVCAACGSGIPYDRLLVFPEAPECGSCL